MLNAFKERHQTVMLARRSFEVVHPSIKALFAPFLCSYLVLCCNRSVATDFVVSRGFFRIEDDVKTLLALRFALLLVAYMKCS